jgi:hypothetical protein
VVQALIPLGSVTVGAVQAAIVFANIPSSYKDLKIIINGTTVSGGSAFLTFNSDTASNYSWVRAYGDGTNIGGSVSSSYGYVYLGDIGGSTSPTTIVADIMEYSTVDKHKVTLSKSVIPSQYIFMVTGRWASLAAVTNISVTSSGGNFSSGTTVSLFGVIG